MVWPKGVKIEVEKGWVVKEWEFWKTEKILLYQFFNWFNFAFMVCGWFPLRSGLKIEFVLLETEEVTTGVSTFVYINFCLQIIVALCLHFSDQIRGEIFIQKGQDIVEICLQRSNETSYLYTLCIQLFTLFIRSRWSFVYYGNYFGW